MPYFEPKTLVSQRGFSILFLAVLVLMVFGGIIIGDQLASYLVSQVYGPDLINLDSMDTLRNISDYPEARTPLLLKQGLSALIGFILVPWIYLRFILKKSIKVLSPNKNIQGITWILAFMATLAFMVINSRIVEWNMQWDLAGWFGPIGELMMETEELLAGVTQYITQFDTTGQFLLAMLVIGVLPAIGEELLFRGCVQNQLLTITRNGHLAIWLTGFLFSAIHFQFLGFVPRMLLGVLFGYLYFWSGNLLVPILGHFFNNGLQVFLLYTYQKGGISYNIDEVDYAPWWLTGVSAVVLAGLLFYFKSKTDHSGYLVNTGKWQNVFHSDQKDRIEMVKTLLSGQGMHPVVIDSTDHSMDRLGEMEVHVAPQFAQKAMKIIEEKVKFE